MGFSLQTRALTFATHHHRAVGQVRKYTGDPYIVHPIEVAMIVGSVPHTAEMIAAAYLHDVVEDTAATIEQVQERFGEHVASLVGWLTDVSKPDDGNRAFRKALDREHIARAPAEVQTIKLADLIDNTRTIAERDPEFWKVYRVEKMALLEVLGKGDRTLWEQALRQVAL